MMPTIQDFKDTIEVMREVYPFKDNNTFIAHTKDMCSHIPKLELVTVDDSTGVEVSLVRDYLHKER